MAAILVGASSLAAGCSPLTAPPPFHFLETSRVLAKDQVAITLGAGGGGTGLDGSAAGGSARVRVGVGGHQELGFEGAGLWVNHGWSGAQKYVDAPSGAFAGKLAYKWAPRPWVALLAGAGGSRSATGPGLGGDLGLVIACDRCKVRPYAGARFTIGVPVDHPVHEQGGVTPGLVGAVGLSLPAGAVRFLVEAGGIFAWSEPEARPPSAITNVNPWHQHGGGYGAIAIEIPVR